MCMGGGSAPKVPDAVPVPAPAQDASETMKTARESQAKKAASANGAAATVSTSGLGDTTTPNLQKQKLGA